MPQLGGLAIFLGYLAAFGLIIALFAPGDASSWRELLIPEGHNDVFRLRGVLIGTIVVFVGGLLDDKFDLAPRWQFGIQFLAAFISIYHVVFLEIFTNPLTGGEVKLWRPLVWLITTIWIVGMMNAVNWLDGLDGLATGVGGIAALVFAGHAYQLNQEMVAAVPLALAGSLFGFLLFNYAPASIFLGSAGVYILAYNLATLAILSPAKMATALLVLALPLLDGLWRVFDRLRQGRSPVSGDRGHLHFVLFDAGYPTRQIVLGYYAIAIVFGLVALFAPNGLVKLIVLVGLSLGILIFLGRIRPS